MSRKLLGSLKKFLIFSSFPIPRPIDTMTSEVERSMWDVDSLNFSPGIIVSWTSDKSILIGLIKGSPWTIFSILKQSLF